MLTHVIRKLGFVETVRLGLFTSLNEKTKQDLYAQKEITIQMICDAKSDNIPDALMFVRNSLFPTPFDLLCIEDNEMKNTVKEVFEIDERIKINNSRNSLRVLHCKDNAFTF